MKITYTFKENQNKKTLVADVAATLGARSVYLGPPSFAYTIGEFTVDRDGCLITDGADANTAEQLIEALLEKGYEGDAEEVFEGLSVSFPRKKISDAGIERLKLLLAAKDGLIKKALGISELPIEIDEEKISFPWFPGQPSPDEIAAYSDFICRLCQFAEKQKRVTATEKPVENEKYAFRCFLLRIGFIGDDEKMKNARKVLLGKLSGSAAFKSGKKKDAGEEPAEEKPTQDEALVAATEAALEGGEENE